MKRRFNYTGRNRITQDRISIAIDPIKQSFDANMNFEGMELPENCKVFVEAYHRTELRRYSFGTVGKIVSPDERSLNELADPENIKFRVLVVDASDGKIQASADRIRPVSGAKKKSILRIKFDDIGKQVWRVEYSGEEGNPLLLINNKIPNIEHVTKFHPTFLSCVYPAVLREILTHMIFTDGVNDPEDPSIEWHADWLNFAKSLISDIPICLDPDMPNFDSNDAQKWIDDVIEEFCAARTDLRFFMNTLLGDQL